MSTNEPMTQEQLNAIRERLEVRTSGPWRAIICESADHPPHGNGVIASGSSWPVVDDETMRVEDADLIANAPQDLADLLAEVERLRARPIVDEDMVERGAGTLFKQDFLERNPWADDARAQHSLEQVRVSTPKAWGQYLQVVRAALNAALGTGEGA